MTLEAETYDQLFQRFLNAAHRIVEKKQVEAAQRMISDIQKEWRRRRDQGATAVNFATPERGLLSALGYHVGHNQGQPSKLRRLILKYVLEGELPMVHSAEYMNEWSGPNSPARFQKLVRFLDNMIEGNYAKPNSQLAVKQWREDRDWLEGYSRSDDES